MLFGKNALFFGEKSKTRRKLHSLVLAVSCVLKPCLKEQTPARPPSADLTKWVKVIKWKHGLVPVYYEYH